MSSTSPGDRPSAAVYRRRRLLALLVVVAVIAVVVIIVSNLGRGTAETAAPGATPSADAAAGDSGDAAAEPAPDPSPSASAGTETNADGSCAAGQLTVTPVTDAASYKAGVLPALLHRDEHRHGALHREPRDDHAGVHDLERIRRLLEVDRLPDGRGGRRGRARRTHAADVVAVRVVASAVVHHHVPGEGAPGRARGRRDLRCRSRWPA